MSKFIPQLVKDVETNELCMQVKLGGLSATLPLPADFSSWEEARKDNFYTIAIEHMKAGLIARRNEENRKLRREIKCQN